MFINGTSSSQKVEKILMTKQVLDAPACQKAMKTLKQWKKIIMENRQITIREVA